jgi:hypothetical protein
MRFEDWQDAMLQLGAVRAFDYFKARAMPQFVEPLLEDLLDSFCAGSRDQQRHLLQMFLEHRSPCFGWYARKMAGQAVRNASETDLWRGLVANAIGSVWDYRDALSALALLYNSALRLGKNPKVLLHEVAELSKRPSSDAIRAFADGPPDLREIGKYQFSEGVGPLGFDYIPLLPEFGGPTPI